MCVVLVAFSATLPGACAWSGNQPRAVAAAVPAIAEGVSAAVVPSRAQAPITALRRYRVVSGDELEIVLAGTETVLGVASVSETGTANLPRTGETRVAGLALDEIAAIIEKGHGGGVQVRLKNPQDVYVVGAVRMPGGVVYAEGLTLDALLTRAGGATHRADLRKVFITPRGEAERAVDFEPALPVLPGDVVRLNERYL